MLIILKFLIYTGQKSSIKVISVFTSAHLILRGIHLKLGRLVAFEGAARNDECGLEMEGDRFRTLTLFSCDAVATNELLLLRLLTGCSSIYENEEKHLKCTMHSDTAPQQTVDLSQHQNNSSPNKNWAASNDYLSVDLKDVFLVINQ